MLTSWKVKRNAIYIVTTLFAFLSALSVFEFLSRQNYDGVTVLLIGPIKIDLQYVLNFGVNFGAASENSNMRQLLLAGSAVLIVVLLSVWTFSKANHCHLFSAAILSGGGLSNAFERVVYGGVFDYLNISLIFYQNPFSFNLADIYIFLGVCGLLVYNDQS